MFNFSIILFLVCCAVIDTESVVQENLNHQVKKNHHPTNSETFFEKNLEIEINDGNEKTSVDSNNPSIDELLSQIFSKQQQQLLGNQLDEFRELEDLLRRNIRQDIKNWQEKKPDAKVGFGGNPQANSARILFANMTTYVNKAINQAQQRLKQYGSRIYANIPPYVIYKIPRTPIIFVLKYIEGASTITTQGTSMGLHYYDSLFSYVQFKFQQIRYYYEVQIKPMNWFTIRKSLTVILEDARVWMPTEVENNTLAIQHFEFVKPLVSVVGANNRFINYLLNDILIDKYYPETKQKLAYIASRDTKILLDAHVKDAQ